MCIWYTLEAKPDLLQYRSAFTEFFQKNTKIWLGDKYFTIV